MEEYLTEPILQFAQLPEFSEYEEECEDHGDDCCHCQFIVNLRDFVHNKLQSGTKMLREETFN